MKIENGPQRAELDSLRKQKSKLIANEESEIEALKSYYKDKQEVAKIGHEGELSSLQDAQRKQLLAQIDHYQEGLNQKLYAYRNQEADLEKSRLALAQTNKQEIKDMHSEFLDKRDFQFQDTLQRTEDMRHQSDMIVKKSQMDASTAAADGQRYFGLALDQQARSNEAHMRRNEHQIQLDTAEREKERELLLKNLSAQTAKDLQYETNRSQNLIDGQRKTYETQMTVEQERFKALINQQRENFQQRYNTIKQANDQVIKNSSSKLFKDFSDLQAKYINQKELIETRGQDPFYHPTILQPRVEDLGKYYLVHLEMPEHEKEFVTFNANQRMLKMSFTRKMGENFQTEDGSINKSNRSELMTKEISVPEIVDAKSIKQKYENGVLTFRITKA
ncbi:MAG: Hsp20 family protein [Bdellovibrionota bacterium]